MDIEKFQRTTRIVKEWGSDEWHVVGFASMVPGDVCAAPRMTNCGLTFRPEVAWMVHQALPDVTLPLPFPPLCESCLHSIWKELKE